MTFSSPYKNFSACMAEAPLTLADGELVFATNWFPVWWGMIDIVVRFELGGGGIYRYEGQSEFTYEHPDSKLYVGGEADKELFAAAFR